MVRSISATRSAHSITIGAMATGITITPSTSPIRKSPGTTTTSPRNYAAGATG